jgi:parallel beta-helix repeat protein
MNKTKWCAKPIYVMVGLALVLSLAIAAVPMAGTVEANAGCCDEAWVDDDNPDPSWYNVTCHFHTIQEGVAAVCDGGTVHVASGQYAGGIDVAKANVRIKSTDGPKRTIVTDIYRYGFSVASQGVTIEGFNITGFTGVDSPSPEGAGDSPEFGVVDSGYGIDLWCAADNCTIKNNIIENNGHGILVFTDNNQILHNNILNNSAMFDSGIHLAEDASGNEIHCNNIEGNLIGVAKGADYLVSAFSQVGGTVNATNNYWGCSGGPGAAGCDTVSGPVLYVPWLPKPFELCEECVGAPPRVPTTNHWGIVAMTALFAGLLVWTVRRRRLAS